MPLTPVTVKKVRPMKLRALLIWTLFLTLGLCSTAADARRERLDLRLTSVNLPGAPSTVVSTDLDGDGLRDLVVAIAYTEWDQLAVEESTQMDNIEGLVEVLTIVPALTDRRELRVFLGTEDGSFRALDHVLPLEKDILALERGFRAVPLVAVTDRGISALRLENGRLRFEPLIEDRPVLAGSGNFVPRLGMTHDLNADGRNDLLFPSTDGAAVYLATDTTYSQIAAAHLALPTDRRSAGHRLTRFYPMPEVRDVDGDRRPDLVFRDTENGLVFHVMRNLLTADAGQGGFAPSAEPLSLPNPKACNSTETSRDSENSEDEPCSPFHPDFAYFGDLDGDGRAEYVTQESMETEDAGARQEVKEAKRPPFRYQLFHSRDDLSAEPQPYATFEALGYTFNTNSDDNSITIPGGFQDLDGDGRQDLLALTLDFSIFQAVRVMTTHTISIGLDFNIYCQQPDGGFRAVTGLDLSGKFKIDLDNVQMRQISLFDGDFDGDGRADFVQLGRGRTVSIHRGREGCDYPNKPDLILKLEEEPRNLALVNIEDYDADGFSDLMIVQPNKIEEAGVTPPVRLDLYLSGRAGSKEVR